MHFFNKKINLDHVESIEWEKEGEGIFANDIAKCILSYRSGYMYILYREEARALWAYLQAQEEK